MIHLHFCKTSSQVFYHICGRTSLPKWCDSSWLSYSGDLHTRMPFWSKTPGSQWHPIPWWAWNLVLGAGCCPHWLQRLMVEQKGTRRTGPWASLWAPRSRPRIVGFVDWKPYLYPWAGCPPGYDATCDGCPVRGSERRCVDWVQGAVWLLQHVDPFLSC